MSDYATALVARQAARDLALEFGPSLPDSVEVALAVDPLDQPASKVLDPISIGALIVSVAALGWTIYHDLKRDRETPTQIPLNSWLRSLRINGKRFLVVTRRLHMSNRTKCSWSFLPRLSP